MINHGLNVKIVKKQLISVINVNLVNFAAMLAGLHTGSEQKSPKEPFII